MASTKTPDIAVVGMACRFPGSATSPERLWDMLKNGESAFRRFPNNRLNINGFYHPSPERPDSFNFRGAHFLDEDIGAFDRMFFDVSAEEAKAIDPQQRLLLEVTYEAVENAGIPMQKLKGSQTSVWIGSFVKDYEQISMTDAQTTLADCATGNGNAILANRISHSFDLHGTSQTIDTGCSGSLVAVHQAVQDLRSGNSDMAIAGGVGLIITPGTIMPMTSLGFLSKDGKSFTFDTRANGYGRGEGAGIVILKPLANAIRDNDTIRAIIRGTASNQDGKTPGITIPNPEAQTNCIKMAYADAGLSLGDTEYVECHGTGTPAGDPRELKALSETVSRRRDSPVLVGSVKPNIGHLEGAAGIAGFIKAVLVIEKGQIPKHINFEKWNPDIKHEEWKVDVARETAAFPLLAGNLRRTSVNCFGFGGTNAHAVLDDARSYLEQRKMTAHHNVAPLASHINYDSHNDMQSCPHLFIFTAKSRASVADLVKSHLRYVKARSFEPAFLQNYEYTLYARRSQLGYNYHVVARTVPEILEKMEAVSDNKISRAPQTKNLQLAYIFCGQGMQWKGMGKMLKDFPVFRESIEAAAKFMSGLARSFDLLQVLWGLGSDDEIHFPENAQPSTTAIQVAFVELLRCYGVYPASVVGHSSGEIAAAFAAGYISREAAWSLALCRGLSAARLRKESTLIGGMIAVGLSQAEAEQYIAHVESNTVCVACINGPRLVTLSGDREQILVLKSLLEENKVFNRLLPGTVAYHSRHMLAVADSYLDTIRVAPQEGDPEHPVKMYSSLTGGLITPDLLTADYWVQNLVSPVQFEQAVNFMIRDSNPSAFIEISPHSGLGTTLEDISSSINPRNKIPYLPISRRGRDEEGFLHVLAFLWSHEQPADLLQPFEMNCADSAGARMTMPKCLVDLPTYPWDHSKAYWHESHISKQLRFRNFGRLDYLGAPTNDAIMPLEPRWRGYFRVAENPWLLDHKIQGEVLYPAAGMIVMAVEAAKQTVHDLIDGPRDILEFEIFDFSILAPMVVPTNDMGLEHMFTAARLETLADGDIKTWVYSFYIYSRQRQNTPYQRNATGSFRVRFLSRGTARFNAYYQGDDSKLMDWKPKPESELQHKSPFEFYEELNVTGMNYGPQFQNLVSIGRRELSDRSGETRWECETVVKIPDTKSKMPMQFEYDHVIHPATLDGIFQTVFTLGNRRMLPSAIKSIRISGAILRLTGYRFSVLSGAKESSRDTIKAYINVLDRKHNLSVKIDGLLLREIPVQQGVMQFLPSHRHLCSQPVWDEDVTYARFDGGFLRKLGHKNPDMNVLQIGDNLEAGTLAMKELGFQNPDGPRLNSYTIRSKTPASFRAICNMSHPDDIPLLQYEQIGEDDPESETSQKFDLIIVDYRTSTNLADLHRLVAASGFLIVADRDHNRAKAKEIIQECTATGELNLGPHMRRDTMCGACYVFYKPPRVPGPRTCTVLLLESQEPSQQERELGEELYKAFTRNGLQVSKVLGVPVLEEESDVHVVSLLELSGGFVFNVDEKNYESLRKLLVYTKKLLWVSRGAQGDCPVPTAATFLGWSRTIRSEDPSKKIVCVDFDGWASLASNGTTIIQKIFIDSFLNTQPIQEAEYLVYQNRVHVKRLLPLKEINTIIEQPEDTYPLTEHTYLSDGSQQGLKLHRRRPGTISNKNFYFAPNEVTSQDLKAHDVLVKIKRAQISRVDVTIFLDKTDITTGETNVVGTVTKTGSAVKSLNVGQDVVTRAVDALQTHIVVPESAVQRRFPLHDSPSEQDAFRVAYKYLIHRYGLLAGQPILILDSAGSYGMAALFVAQEYACNVVAVVRNKEEQASIVSFFGMRKDRVIVNDYPDIVARLQDAASHFTSGADFKVIFDPAPGNEYIDYACVSRNGTILRLVSPNLPDPEKVERPKYPIQCIEIDPAHLLVRLEDESTPMSKMSEKYQDKVQSHRPLRFRVAEIGDALRAFRNNQTMNYVEIDFTEDQPIPVSVKPAVTLDPQAIYLLIGGLGGLGLDIAEFLAAHGAKNLVIFSRTTEKQSRVAHALARLRSMGVWVHVCAVDICDRAALCQELELLRRLAPMFKLKGVIQAAGVLKDMTYGNMSYEAWRTASRVKTIGTMNLHETLPADLDFFILLSSAAGIIGNRGQANYAAGNTFQDALAWHRACSPRFPQAISLDLGPIIGAGMVDQAMMDHLRGVGFFGIRKHDFHTILGLAIRGFVTENRPFPAQLVVGVGTGGLLRQNKPMDPFWARTALFSHLNRLDAVPGEGVLSQDNPTDTQHLDLKPALRAVTTIEDAIKVLHGPLATAMAAIIPNLEPGDVTLDVTPFECSSDSMRGVSIDNWLRRTTGVSIGMSINAMTIRAICEEVVRIGGYLTLE